MLKSAFHDALMLRQRHYAAPLCHYATPLCLTMLIAALFIILTRVTLSRHVTASAHAMPLHYR